MNAAERTEKLELLVSGLELELKTLRKDLNNTDRRDDRFEQMDQFINTLEMTVNYLVKNELKSNVTTERLYYLEKVVDCLYKAKSSINVKSLRSIYDSPRKYEYVLIDKDGNELPEKAYSFDEIRKIMSASDRVITEFCLKTYSHRDLMFSRPEPIDYINNVVTIKYHQRFLEGYIPRNAPFKCETVPAPEPERATPSKIVPAPEPYNSQPEFQSISEPYLSIPPKTQSLKASLNTRLDEISQELKSLKDDISRLENNL